MQNSKITTNKILSLLLLIIAMAFIMPKAKATTIILDFSSNPSSDIYGATTGAFDETLYGFTTMNYAAVINNVYLAITRDFLGYSYANLPTGKELDIDFEIGSIGTGPTNGDTDYSYFQLGNVTSGESYFGHACLGCALTTSGYVVGSIFTNNIARLAGLATNDAQLINLIAGTTSHEIGHALSLPHPSGPELNPGDSTYGLMGTGASPTSMPNSERVLDRAFSNSNFDTLIAAVGLRDIAVTEPEQSIPEPSTIFLFLSAVIMVSVQRKKYQ